MTRPRTELTRLREYASNERGALDALLDSTPIGHVGLVDDTGMPVVIPTAIVRHGDRVLMHGSTGSHWMRRLATGVPTCLAVTAFDGLVVARSAFESSMHYRSAVLFGNCRALPDNERGRALDAITETLLPGRTAEVRRPAGSELAATLVLALPIVQWSLKVSDGWPDDPPEDVAGPAWAGTVAREISYADPVPAPDLGAGVPTPPSVQALRPSGSTRS